MTRHREGSGPAVDSAVRVVLEEKGRPIMSTLHVGLIGVGYMGRGIARNLLRQGHASSSVVVNHLSLVDPNIAGIESLLQSLKRDSSFSIKNVTCQTSAAGLLNDVDICALSLPSESVCEEVLFNPKTGLIPTMKSQKSTKVIVDHSTYSKSFVVQCSDRVSRESGQRVKYTDAPVSGGPKGAWDGTLSIMIGGDDSTVHSVMPVLKLYSGHQYHIGQQAGAGK